VADTAYDVLLMLLPLLLQGLEMLIRDFGYHIAYKRWQDTFTAVPFKPK
jgi:hypothetical protein